MERIKIAAYVVFYIFAALLLYELLSSLKHFVFDKRQKKKQPKKYILMNDYFLVIGLIGHAFFFGIMAICVVWQSLSPQYTPTENYELSFITIILQLPCIFLSLVSANWKIELNDDFFFRTDMFGIRHKYRYDEIEIKVVRSGLRVYKNGRFRFSLMFIQDDCFDLDIARNKFLKRQAKIGKGNS